MIQVYKVFNPQTSKDFSVSCNELIFQPLHAYPLQLLWPNTEINNIEFDSSD